MAVFVSADFEGFWKAVDTFHCSQSGYLSPWVPAPYPLCEADIYWREVCGRLSCQRQSVASSGWKRLLCLGFHLEPLTESFFRFFSLPSTLHTTSKGTDPCMDHILDLFFCTFQVLYLFCCWSVFSSMGMSTLQVKNTLVPLICANYAVWWWLSLFSDNDRLNVNVK